MSARSPHDEHGVVGAVAPAQVGDHGNDDGADDALFDAQADDDDCRAGGDHELVQADAIDAAHPFQVDQLDAYEEHHRGEDSVRQVLERTGEKQQDQEYDRRGRQRGNLAPSPTLSTIWVFVGLPFTTNAPENPAARLAAPSPSRSTFSSNASPYWEA